MDAVGDKFELERGEYITSHDLRRTLATACASNGMKLKMFSVLAHRKKNVTQRYIKLSNESNRAKLEQVQQYLNQQSNDGIFCFYISTTVHLILDNQLLKKSLNILIRKR